nr:triphosphoribosyl-dephospho-CoA synthase [uncultured Desulfuromonas sp.]
MIRMPLYAPLTTICAALPGDSLGDAFCRGARRELLLTPKPGLVDLFDNGAHNDLNLIVMQQSIDLLSLYYQELMAVPISPVDIDRVRAIGRAAEERMWIHCRTNTHKGYVFVSGLVLLALRCGGDLRHQIRTLSRDLFTASDRAGSHGETCQRLYGCRGIVGECLEGLPAVFEQGLPCYRYYRSQGHGETRSGLALMARLMQVVDDSTCYHRAGLHGATLVRHDGVELEQRIAAGRDVESWLVERNRRYLEINLTMGGVADMMAVTFALDQLLEEEGADHDKFL